MKRSGKIGLGILGLFVLALLVAHVIAEPAAEHAFFRDLPDDRPLVIAHRGGALLWPENTLVSFAGGHVMGSDMLEMDIFATADGVPVVIHDTTVDRTTDGSGPVGSFTLEELKELDAGYNFSPVDRPGDYPYRGMGITVPTLREVFETFPDARMIVEIKENDTDLADAIVSLVREFDRVETTLLASFHHEMLEYFREVEPAAATHGSEQEAVPFLIASWLLLGGVVSPEYEALMVPQTSGPIPVTTRRFFSAASRRNVFVGAWTINDPEDMRLLVRRGVDGLLTDRPDLALEAVGVVQWE